ncbi:MAG: hypothetical protein AAGA23_12060 [Pseudomonadota bacterium]
MTVVSRIAPVAVSTAVFSLALSSGCSTNPTQESIFNQSLIMLPTPFVRRAVPSREPTFCLLGAPHCGDLHPRPVEPCLLAMEKCAGDVQVQLLSIETNGDRPWLGEAAMRK